MGADSQSPGPWAIALAGMASLGVAMGIGRFAFTPILPMMLADGVLDLPAASWLASANYLGYLVGALLCMLQPWLWTRFPSLPSLAFSQLVRGGLLMTGVQMLVIDEADRMLDMGFADEIGAIAQQCPPPGRRQTLLFSATYPEGVAQLAARYLREPLEVKLAERHAPGLIHERCYEVAESERLHAVGLLLNHFRPESTLAFSNTKQQCHDLVAVRRYR
jgi:hypothetical protein